MDQIFITDLDGTLLNSSGSLSLESEAILNQVATETSHKIAFATARGLASAQKVIQRVQWNFPVLLNNGAVIYDWTTQKILKINGIENQYVQKILCITADCGISPFIFTLNESFEEGIFYQKNPSSGMQSFLDLRPNDPRFLEVDLLQSHPAIENTQSLVLMFIAEYETLVPLKLYFQEHFKNEIKCLLTQDQYIANQFVLELSGANATKENGITYLKNLGNIAPQDLHLFGDNLNDKGMLELEANTYAVSNAHAVILETAQHRIKSNDENGVAQVIEKRAALQK